MRIEYRSTWIRLAFFLCLVVVLVLSLMPPQPLPTTGWDKTNHVLAFATLAILGCRSYPQSKSLVLLGLLAYGGLIEILQGLTGYRTAELLDVVADGVGLLIGWPLARVSLRRLR